MMKITCSIEMVIHIDHMNGHIVGFHLAREQSPVPKHMVHPLSWEKLHLFLRKFRKHSYTGYQGGKGTI